VKKRYNNFPKLIQTSYTEYIECYEVAGPVSFHHCDCCLSDRLWCMGIMAGRSVWLLLLPLYSSCTLRLVCPSSLVCPPFSPWSNLFLLWL